MLSCGEGTGNPPYLRAYTVARALSRGTASLCYFSEMSAYSSFADAAVCSRQS